MGHRWYGTFFAGSVVEEPQCPNGGWGTGLRLKGRRIELSAHIKFNASRGRFTNDIHMTFCSRLGQGGGLAGVDVQTSSRAQAAAKVDVTLTKRTKRAPRTTIPQEEL